MNSDEMRAERDRRGASPIAYPVEGGRGFVELLAWDGSVVHALDGCHHEFEIYPEALGTFDDGVEPIVRRFIASWGESGEAAE